MILDDGQIILNLTLLHNGTRVEYWLYSDVTLYYILYTFNISRVVAYTTRFYDPLILGGKNKNEKNINILHCNKTRSARNSKS